MRTPRLHTMLLAAAGWVVVAAVGCRQVIGIEERAHCEQPGKTLEGCEGCMRAACCDAFEACQNDPLCAALDACVSACTPGDEACRAKCRTDQPAGLRDAFARLVSCRSASCGGACGESCGGYVYPDETCAGCATDADACCADAAACAADDECMALSFCELGCSTADHACLGECQILHAPGLRRAGALGTCLANECPTECGDHPDWRECLDKEPQPVGTGPAHTQTVQLRFAGNFLPAYGVEVGACRVPPNEADNGMAWTCPVPEASAVTNKAGDAVLTVEHGFTGYLRVDAIGYPRTLHFVDAPLTVSAEIVIVQTYWDNYFAGIAPLGTADPSRGQVTLEALDCAREPAVGVTYALEPYLIGTLGYYGLSGENTAHGTVKGNAYGGFIDVEPNRVYVLRITRADTLACVATRRLFVLPGTITQMGSIAPGPCHD